MACCDAAPLVERLGGPTGAKQAWDDQPGNSQLGWGHTVTVTHTVKRTGPARDSELPQCGGSLSSGGYFGCGDINQTRVRAREMLGSGQILERVAWVGSRARLCKRIASGQLEPGGGDEMPFASHHEPLICGQKNTTSLWAAWARVAPGLLLCSSGLVIQFSSLQASSPGIPTPRSLLSCFVLTQSWATWASRLFGRNSWILAPWPPPWL